MARIFLTHPEAARRLYYGDQAIAGLRRLSDLRINESGHELSLPELVEAARDCEIIISYRQTAGDAQVFRALPKLVAFSRCAIDIRNVDVAAASAEGILVTQASAGFLASVSEWVVGVMIDLSRGITAATEAYHAGRAPAIPMGRELRGATLGLIGHGQISRYLAPLAQAFGMQVLATDPHAQMPQAGVTRVELSRLLTESDYVVCLAVANEDTENLMNARSFALMKPTAFFINPSRGNLVDEAALRHALDAGQIAGCALDVGRAPDQMPTPELARLPRVIATPHVGGLTPPAIEHQALETVAQVAEILQGRAPRGAVNADKATRLARLAG